MMLDGSSVFFQLIFVLWSFLCEQVKEHARIIKDGNKKRAIRMIKMHPRIKQEAYHGPRTVETLIFSTEDQINCLRSHLGNMIGFGMSDVPSLAGRFK
jgi:hypothetical protein